MSSLAWPLSDDELVREILKESLFLFCSTANLTLDSTEQKMSVPSKTFWKATPPVSGVGTGYTMLNTVQKELTCNTCQYTTYRVQVMENHITKMHPVPEANQQQRRRSTSRQRSRSRQRSLSRPRSVPRETGPGVNFDEVVEVVSFKSANTPRNIRIMKRTRKQCPLKQL
jgi:hypothetical protein